MINKHYSIVREFLIMGTSSSGSGRILGLQGLSVVPTNTWFCHGKKNRNLPSNSRKGQKTLIIYVCKYPRQVSCVCPDLRCSCPPVRILWVRSMRAGRCECQMPLLPPPHTSRSLTCEWLNIHTYIHTYIHA